MDQELKQRLIGAAVVTALAAIFIPMLFDDPVDTSGQAVSEMTIPEVPATPPTAAESKLPTDAASVENAAGNPPATDLNAGAIEKIEPGLQENAPADYEPPADVEPSADAEAIPEEEAEIVPSAPEPVTEQAPPAPKKSSPAKAVLPKTIAPVSEQTAPTPVVKPVPAKPIEAPAAKPAPKGSAKFERWTIQAGSFTKKENAALQRDKLRKLGFPATLETLSTGQGTMYRLKIGPELDKQRALDIRNRLNQQNIKTIILAE
ncbi:SPOR domain-containing protein [Methylomicrobium lacus]|uniref:SPOR domain-containing protein n=1 Tax=Methylomicrobium lacus TaxID=136992 RepID=UPI0035A94B0C